MLKEHNKKVVICWFSCGVTSAVACYLAMKTYGKDKCVFIYIDHGSVHLDNERYIQDFENKFQIKIIRKSNGRYLDQFDVIEKTKYVNGVAGARCSLELKKKVRFEIEKKYNYVAQVFGFEFEKSEINRALKFEQQYPQAAAIFPLIENKWSKANCMAWLKQHGIPTPIMYTLGYNNNNCIGCVKGGAGYWNKIRRDFPMHFQRMAELERSVGHSCIRRKYLDELEPNEGYNEKAIVPDCGPFCDIEGLDRTNSLVEGVLNGSISIDYKKKVRKLLGSTQ